MTAVRSPLVHLQGLLRIQLGTGMMAGKHQWFSTSCCNIIGTKGQQIYANAFKLTHGSGHFQLCSNAIGAVDHLRSLVPQCTQLAVTFMHFTGQGASWTAGALHQLLGACANGFIHLNVHPSIEVSG